VEEHKRQVPEKIKIAKVINIHGVHGEVKAIPLSDFKERYQRLEKVYVQNNDGVTSLKIENVRWHKNNLLFKFKNIDTIEEALYLKNMYLLIDVEDIVELPEDSYYFFEIIGLEVFEEFGDRRLGVVVDILQTGANDVYVVRDTPSGRELLIPALKQVIKEINLEENRMTVNLPEGLVD